MALSQALADELRDAFAGQFMQPVIHSGEWFEVETDQGTETVPDDVFGFTGLTIAADRLQPYVNGSIDEDHEPVEKRSGWLARLSASGYMDCTEWSTHATADDAARYLIDTYAE